jgi:ATP-dependent Clp protease ATP-binding subunit ClpC
MTVLIIIFVVLLTFQLLPRDPINAILQLLPFRMSGFPSIKWGFFLALACLVFPFWMTSNLVIGFTRQKLMRAGKALESNVPGGDLLEYLDFEAAQVMMWVMQRGHLPFQKVLLYRILKTRRLAFAFQRLLISHDELEKELLAHMKEGARLYQRGQNFELEQQNQAMRQHILERAGQLSLDNSEQRISVFTLFLAIAKDDEALQAIMDRLQLLDEDLTSVVLWQLRMENYQNFHARYWERDNLRRGLATSPVDMVVGGYTVLLDQYSHNITLTNPLRQGGVVLHTLEIELLEEALIKQKGNGILLVGDAGSGRKSIVYNFANRMAAENSPGPLKKMRVLEVDMVSLIGNNPNKATLAAELERIFQEAVMARNVVLIIPQIHNYIGPHFGAESVAQIDISGVISTYLSYPGFRVIGIATYEGYHQSIEQAGEIAKKFMKIEVARVSTSDAMRVLKEEGLRRELASGIFIPIATLKEIVKLCDYFLGDEAFPEKAVNLLDDLVANKISRGRGGTASIMPADVDAYFSHKYEVPAGAAGAQEKEILINLEDRIHEGLVNQQEAVEELANAMRRARAEIKKRKRTIGNFLFLGPTGVGKTETAKQLARVYFGSEKNMIRLNMSEYQTIESIDKLIGKAGNAGTLTTAVRENPFSLVLIDEIEKAHPGLLNIFLNVFDEGEMTDGFGRTIDFKHTIIIATSNAGAEYIKEAVERGSTLANLKNSFIDNLLRRNIFKPEFLNRFDALVLYRPLTGEEMQQVAALMLSDIKAGLAEKRIELNITPQLTQKLGQLGFDPAFGGRAMRRVVQDKIENVVAKAVLAEKIKSGDVCEFNTETWELLAGDEIAAYHAQKAIPVEEAADPLAELLMNLEDRIHEGLINQNEAVAELANAMRRAHANLKESKRTIGNFLFLGPTGVGKTETAKQLARVYFGSEKNMIRLNMAEYQNVNSLDKLIGNLETPGLLTTQVTERPRSLILIDEIEKASPRILNIFLSVFDDGQLTDGTGHAVDFKQTIIIATSNAGAQYIKEAIEKGIALDDKFKKTFIDSLLQQGMFTPEFINRFDAVALYRSLDSNETKQVAALMLKEIQNGLAAKGITFNISEALVAKLVELGFDPVFGGRSMRRAIQDKVENAIAAALLSRAVKRGDTVEIDIDSWKMVVTAGTSTSQ